MSVPYSTTQKRSSGILARLSVPQTGGGDGNRTDKRRKCVAKTDKNGKRKRVRRQTERRYDPLRRRSVDEWRRQFEALGEITLAVICCARKVYWDYPDSAPVTSPFRDAYREITYLPDDEEVVLLLLRLGYTPLQACRSLALTGRDNGDPESDRAVNVEKHSAEAARFHQAWEDEDEAGKAYVFRWSHELNVAPRNRQVQNPNPMLAMTESKSSLTSGGTTATGAALLGVSVRDFLTLADMGTPSE